MKTLRQRFDQNEIPMQTIAALSGAQLSDVSRLVSGRQKVNADRAKDIIRALETLESLLEYFAPIRPDLFDVKAVRRALKQMEHQKMLTDAIRGATPIVFATFRPAEFGEAQGTPSDEAMSKIVRGDEV
jgi:hypothetical protein